MQKRHRIFIAINLAQDVRRHLAGFQKQWANLPAKWVTEDNLHITLVFLGNLTDVELGEACMVVKKVAERHKSFQIHISKVTYGPDDKLPPRMVWARGGKSKEFSSLKGDLEKSLLEKIHFAFEHKAFSPHVTLARISTFLWRQINPEERPQVAQDIDIQLTVDSIEIVESELKRGGRQYTVVESHSLQ